MYCRTIYKKDNSGKIRYLTVNTVATGELQQISGVMNTDNPVVHSKICIGKNIDKANETTPKQQAVLEAESIIAEKMRLGYFDTVDEALEKGGKSFLLPMLAKDYKKEIKKVKYPCYVQPKLDGMRGLGESEGIISRTGKPVETVNHIDLSFLNDEVIDGEIYEHGESFQGIMRKVKKYRQGETEQLKYHVYDMVSDLPFSERFLKLHALIQGRPNIELVHTSRIYNEKDLIEMHKQNLANGYEGTMVRHLSEGYQLNKRSSQLLKYKDFLDEAYNIVDVKPSEARPNHGTFVCEINVNGKINHFKTGMKFSHDEREKILTNASDYIGKKAEVRFFEFSEDGIPRFPVSHGVRLDK